MSVDLPAPLPPTNPMTSPSLRSMDTSRDGVDAAEGDADVAHLDQGWALVDRHLRTPLQRPPPRRRLYESRPTATMRTTPATMFWVGVFTPTNARP